MISLPIHSTLGCEYLDPPIFQAPSNTTCGCKNKMFHVKLFLPYIDTLKYTHLKIVFTLIVPRNTENRLLLLYINDNIVMILPRKNTEFHTTRGLATF